MEKGACSKCGHLSDENRRKFGIFLCNICFSFSPSEESKFNEYFSQKVDGNILETFREGAKILSKKKKISMIEKASQGNLMSRIPFGYSILEGKLIPAENYHDVEKIFEEFLNSEISLRQLSKKYNLSVNGLKKILRNFTYLGKIKFNNQVHEGTHQPIVSSTLFNHVQNKLESLGIK